MNPEDPRFTLAAWQRYELHVAAWMDVWPLDYSFSPNELALETVRTRLRDAVKAKLHFNYPSSVVDHELLKQRWPGVVVTRHRTQKGYIRIGPNEGRQKINLTSSTLSLAHKNEALIVQSPQLSDLIAVAHLLNRGILVGEVLVQDYSQVVLQGLTHELTRFPNVEIVEQTATSFIML